MKSSGKQEHILEVAIKRLSYYGVSKTTLTELADDLDMSKQALMYHFHDKDKLVAAVVEKIATEYLEQVKLLINEKQSLELVFTGILDLRYNLLRKYYMLLVEADHEGNIRHTQLTDALKDLRNGEEELLVDLLASSPEFNATTLAKARETVKLIMETVTAIAKCSHSTRSLPTIKDMDELLNKQKNIMLLMINGLKAK